MSPSFLRYCPIRRTISLLVSERVTVPSADAVPFEADAPFWTQPLLACIVAVSLRVLLRGGSPPSSPDESLREARLIFETRPAPFYLLPATTKQNSSRLALLTTISTVTSRAIVLAWRAAVFPLTFRTTKDVDGVVGRCHVGRTTAPRKRRSAERSMGRPLPNGPWTAGFLIDLGHRTTRRMCGRRRLSMVPVRAHLRRTTIYQ